MNGIRHKSTISRQHVNETLPDVFPDNSNWSPQTWFEPSKKKKRPSLVSKIFQLVDSQSLSFFFYLSVSHIQPQHTCTHTHSPGGSSNPTPPVSTFMRSGLHMPLISTYCCLIYLSEGLTLHLLSQTNVLPPTDGLWPLHVSSSYTHYKWQLPLFYGNSLTTARATAPHPPPLNAYPKNPGVESPGGLQSR